uniref:Uncharacterized protein n=1 Tax=Cacopsylla melanoneura TaxID=428564 RepID=A0A8D9EB75_9HEMI
MAAVWNNYQQNSYHQQQQQQTYNSYYNYQGFQSDFNNPHYNDPAHNAYLKSERAAQCGTYSTAIPPPSFGLFDHIESFMESYDQGPLSNDTRSENSTPSSVSGNFDD